MSVYQVKLLELESIKSESDKYFLHLKLSFEQDFEMFCEIDEYTAENLKSLIQFDEKHKYRLSFNCSWDPIQKQHTSILTKTYRDQSDRIYFLCSEDYANKLSTIKNCQRVDGLDKQVFKFTDTKIIEEQSEKQEQNEENTSKKHINRFIRASVAAASIVLVMLLSYLSHIYLNNTAFNEKVLAQSIQLDNEVIAEQNEIVTPNNKITIEDVSSNQPTVPFIELDQTATYSIPEGNVALTFDDGPSQYSIEIMDILKRYEVGGTFFFTGQNVIKYPNYVEYIGSNGYSIGSHSMNHTNMPTLSDEKQKYELVESIRLLEEITNEEITLFRPPYGSFNKQVKNLINEHEYKIVLWNNDPEDWKTRDADEIFNAIQSSNVSGSIILLHESQAVIDALPRIIEYLQELDLKITNLK